MTIDDLSQEAVNTAETTLIAAIQNSDPSLDLSAGGAIRDLLILPGAELHAFTEQTALDLLETTSLSRIKAAGLVPSAELLNPILSNFGTTYKEGTYAQGFVLCTLSSTNSFVLPAGYSFTFTLPDSTTLTFSVEDTLLVSTATTADARIYTVTDGTILVSIPAKAQATGANGNLKKGTVLVPDATYSVIVSATVAQSFSGGSDGETVDDAIARIPVALASKSSSSSLSLQNMLSDAFPVQAAYLHGRSSALQQRNRANVFGIAEAGKLDAFIRSYTDPVIGVYSVVGTKVATGVYRVQLSDTVSSSFIAVKSVYETSDAQASGTVLGGSLDYSVSFGVQASTGTHTVSNATQAAFSSYKTVTLTAETSDPFEDAATFEFTVELYTDPHLADMQTYCDDPTRADLTTDLLLRSALPCFVRVSLKIKGVADTASEATLSTALSTHINKQNFSGTLSLAAITSVLHQAGAGEISLRPVDVFLSGTVMGASGTLYTVTSSADLSISKVASTAELIDKNTVVFVTSPELLDLQVL